MSSSIYSNVTRIKEDGIGTKLQQWTGAELIFVDNIYLADGIAQHFVHLRYYSATEGDARQFYSLEGLAEKLTS